jgi:hypothetical protein
MENKISLDIPPATLTTVLTALGTVKQSLSFLQSLTPDDRLSMPKMGDKTLAFVKKAYDYAKANPTLVPSYISLEEMRKDIETTEKLRTVYILVQELESRIDDSMLLAGSEAYMAALSFYTSVKAAAKTNIPAAKPIAEELSSRFAGQARKKTQTQVPN